MTIIINLMKGLALSWAVLFSTATFAVPSLQLGPGLDSDGSIADGWTYDGADQTWKINGTSSFDLTTYAKAAPAKAKGKGASASSAWDSAGATDRYAYLVVAATPQQTADSFDIAITGDTGSLSMLTSGYGNPPLEDPNSISPHGIYDTYFEIYEFRFDGSLVEIMDTQPGQTGTGKGYTETLSIDILSLDVGLEGLHFDLFTVAGDGRYNPDPNLSDKWLVKAVAPYSHDAEFSAVPEPGLLALLGIGLLGISLRKTLVA